MQYGQRNLPCRSAEGVPGYSGYRCDLSYGQGSGGSLQRRGSDRNHRHKGYGEINAYEKKILEKHPGLKLFSKACPAFVPLIEEGIIDNEIMDLTIKYYLDDFVCENNINTLILGCTHYPLISENLKRIYPEMRIISSSKEVATAVEIELRKRDMFAGRTGGENVFMPAIYRKILSI